jgi:hypothetical protein
METPTLDRLFSRSVKGLISPLSTETFPGEFAGMARPRGGTAGPATLPQPFLDLLKERGLSVSAASRLAGGNDDLLRNIARGQTKRLRADFHESLARGLGVASEELSRLLYAGGVADTARHGYDHALPDVLRRPPVAAGALLPQRFVVNAGIWVERDDLMQAPKREAPPVTAAPGYPRHAQWLELVRGDSMNKRYPPGAWIHVVDTGEIGYEPRHGDLVVVERRSQQDGKVERSLKEVVLKRGGVELWPRSRNPAWDQPLRLSENRNDDSEIVEIAALVLGGYVPPRGIEEED